MANAKHIELPNGTVLDLAGSGGPTKFAYLYFDISDWSSASSPKKAPIIFEKQLVNGLKVEDGKIYLEKGKFYRISATSQGENYHQYFQPTNSADVRIFGNGSNSSYQGTSGECIYECTLDNDYVYLWIDDGYDGGGRFRKGPTSFSVMELQMGGSESGGGGGSSTKIEQLYTGTDLVDTITLNKSFKEYDMLIVNGYAGNNYSSSNVYICKDITEEEKIGIVTDNDYCWYKIINETTLTKANSNGTRLTDIYGIKYGSSSGGSSIHKYSTEEKVVGEWIDGKPVYEKVVAINGTIPSSGTSFESYVKDIENLIFIDGMGHDSNTYKWTLNSCNDRRPLWFSYDYKIIYCANTYFFDYLILRYTKTTD